MLSATLTEQIGVDEVSPGHFISKALPLKMIAFVAYGGSTMSVAVNAAVRTVKPSLDLYSALGHFFGPARPDLKLECRVHSIRDTRTFATRRVEVFQTIKDGETRSCMELVADFQLKEANSLYDFSVPPAIRYSPPDQCPTWDETGEELLAKKTLTKQALNAYNSVFGMLNHFFETRFCPEGISGQTLRGAAKNAPTSQDHLPITSKTSGDWIRTTMALSGEDQAAALAFQMDVAISGIPLIHDHRFLDDVAACGTLDFALRIFVNDLDLNMWHLREMSTQRGGAGRTYSEAKLWNLKGELVASMTQQSILRPLPAPKSSL